jgi:CRP-like cAMP-binding protein
LSLLNRDRPITHVFFPESGCCSLTISMENGDSVELATVGYEGVVGLDLLLGSRVSTVDAFVQVAPGTAQRVSAAAFDREMRKGGALFAIVSKYAAALMAQIVQTAACNRLHMVHERCARWLLLTHERTTGDQFPLSHEFLAIMLGVERTTVTTVAGKLQKAGLIRYVHGQVTIVNRAGLERASCECYGMVADRFERAGLAPG